ncbi:MAG: hypothetical protein HYU31_05830, partial [Deltaproteobacteria bacterium]|nr:hypothetical protein [Deltaproteobacteria bacterium]
MLQKLRKLVPLITLIGVILPSIVLAQAETIDELYKKALKEGGVLNCYCSLAQINAAKIYPVFE